MSGRLSKMNVTLFNPLPVWPKLHRGFQDMFWTNDRWETVKVFEDFDSEDHIKMLFGRVMTVG